MGKKRGTNGSRIKAEHVVIDQSLTRFVVHTLPLHEAKAAEEFQELAMDWWLPRYRVTVVRRGRKIDTQAIFFASYLFVGLDRQRHARRWTEPLFDSRHVIDVLGPRAPLEIPGPVHIMDTLDQALAASGADLALGRTTLAGTPYMVRITGQPAKVPGDLDGDGLLVEPVAIELP
ncbi:transcription termination/antitermination NusG family protein [Methylobacterium sp. P31]